MELLTFSPDGSRVVEEINVIIQRAEIGKSFACYSGTAVHE